MAVPSNAEPGDEGNIRGSVDVTALRHERLARLRAILKQADVAAGLFFDPINIRYATGVSNMQVWCLHNPTRYAFVATEGRVIQFEFASCEYLADGIDTIDEVRPGIPWTYLMSGSDSGERAAEWAAEIADLVSTHGGGNQRLAVDRLDAIGLHALLSLGIEPVDGQVIAEQARSLKTLQELNAIRSSIAGCEAAVRAMHDAAEPGKTEQAIWSVLHQQNIEHGGEWLETRLLSSGPRTNPWYQECSDRIVEAGDLNAFDTDLIGLHGYCSDISRTWRADGGRADDNQRRTYTTAYDHLAQGLKIVGPGVTLAELALRVGKRPAGDHVYSCLIHGIGMCDEFPVGFWADQKGRYDATLLPDMTICVESYYGPANAAEGVKLEEQVLITSSGIDVLSTLPFEEDWL